MANRRRRNRNNRSTTTTAPLAAPVSAPSAIDLPEYAYTDPQPVLNEPSCMDNDEPKIKDFSDLLPAEAMAIYTQAVAISEDIKPIGNMEKNDFDPQAMASMQKSVATAQEMIIENAESREEMTSYLRDLDLNDGIEFIFEKFTEMMDSLGN